MKKLWPTPIREPGFCRTLCVTHSSLASPTVGPSEQRSPPRQQRHHRVRHKRTAFFPPPATWLSNHPHHQLFPFYKHKAKRLVSQWNKKFPTFFTTIVIIHLDSQSQQSLSLSLSLPLSHSLEKEAKNKTKQMNKQVTESGKINQSTLSHTPEKHSHLPVIIPLVEHAIDDTFAK